MNKLCYLFLLFSFSLGAQTGPGAGELIDFQLRISADHIQVARFSGNSPANTGADYYSIRYTTPDIEGVLDTASGLLVIPQRGDIDMAMAVFQRGTARFKQDAASNLSAVDAVFASSVLAGQGMITLAPDYLGMREARGFHPYLDKETEASAAIDMLYAVETFLEQNDIGWNGQLFLTGFSQGGHAAMALHEELQASYQDDWPVTRSAPISGPYDLSVAEDFFLDTGLQYPPLVLIAYIAVGQQEAEGGLYNSLEDIFAAPYAPLVAQFLSPEWETGAINTDTIQNQLIAAMLPLEGGLFPARMIREEYRQDMLADENHPLRAALRENSPLDWTPGVPVRLPYCEDDPIVFSEFILNAETIFLNLGADVEAINGGAGIGHGDCLPPSLFTALGFFDEVRTDKGQFVPGGLIHDDSLRAYAVYVPPGYDGSEAWPLVINMHGLGSNIEQQIFASRMTPVADTAQFLIVFPQALTTPIGAAWNDRLEAGLPDDVSFLSRLIDQMATDYTIDPSRVYATGLSNGGAMSHLLACQLSDRIAAVASVAGPILEPVFEDNCNLDRPIPILHIHGTADPVVPFEGGPVIIPGYLAPPVEDYVQFWVNQNNCQGDPAVEIVPDINTADSSTVEIRRYNNCDQGSEVWYYRIDNGSHVWPGGPAVPPGFEFLGTNVNQDIHASVEIWNFFNRHRIITDIREASPAAIRLQVHPNPVSTRLTFDFELPESARVNLTLYNPLGQPLQVLANENMPAGQQRINWERLPSVSAGLYYYHLQVGQQLVSGTVVLR
ncbi:MAG: T9SS type A sorting domain-containing protein [Phaeodactylibacter sp.]|nr:T9SS type A sorting domain-containing protein [Phaeodactylibacter sp.]MCB9289996.1 T9SS type A sorting domain-containing protein [Lewinellaceae bacterium]